MADKNVMVANKPDGKKATESNYKLKVYYRGDTPEDRGEAREYGDILESAHSPWLIKWRLSDGQCRQLADTFGIYTRLSHDFGAILDAVIVNTKQREAVGKILDKMLCDYLGEDMAHEGDIIADPREIWE